MYELTRVRIFTRDCDIYLLSVDFTREVEDLRLSVLNVITRAVGIEPTQVVLKTTVLPLNYTPKLRPQVYWTFTCLVINRIILTAACLMF